MLTAVTLPSPHPVHAEGADHVISNAPSGVHALTNTSERSHWNPDTSFQKWNCMCVCTHMCVCVVYVYVHTYICMYTPTPVCVASHGSRKLIHNKASSAKVLPGPGRAFSALILNSPSASLSPSLSLSLPGKLKPAF